MIVFHLLSLNIWRPLKRSTKAASSNALLKERTSGFGIVRKTSILSGERKSLTLSNVDR